MKLLEKYWQYMKKSVAPEVLDDIVPVDATPAAKWFLGESDREIWEYRKDFPCVLPPGPVTWIEFEMPPVIRSTTRKIERPARHVAALIMTLEIPEEDQEKTLAFDQLEPIYRYFIRKSRIDYGTAISTDKRRENIGKALAEGLVCKWICIWQVWAEPLNKRVLVPFVSYAFYLDQNGQIISDLGLAHVLNITSEIPEDVLNHAFADVLPFLFALSLTHCRNVELVEREVPPPVAKARKEKGIPELKYRQIIIKPMGGKRFVDKNKPMSNHNGMLPLHWVRAHFKTYTAERPLMGRHVGTYFWHMSARGNQMHGEIVKEYKVKEGNL